MKPQKTFTHRNPRRWLLVAAAWLLAGFSASAAPVTQLSVLSFNIREDGILGLSQVIAAITNSGADIVGLQECNASTAQTIASQLGFYSVSDTSPDEASIISRYPIFKIGATTNAYGGVGSVIEAGSGHHIYFFSAHLNYTPYGPYWLKAGSNTTAIVNMENVSRVPGLSELLGIAAPYIASDAPAILVGDFNAPSHEDYASFPWPTSIACTNAGLTDSYRELHSGNPSYPPAFAYNDPGITWTPELSQEPNGVFDRIDFIYYSQGRGAVPTASTELDSNNCVNPWPSDHRAMRTIFTVTPPALNSGVSLVTPANGATNVVFMPLLIWSPASNMISQAVYLGTNSPDTFQAGTTNSVFNPGALTTGTTYYWRVDTTTATGTITGPVWSFTTAAVTMPAANIYEWNFTLGDLKPSLGDGIMTYADGTNGSTAATTTFGTTDGATAPNLNGTPIKYMRFPAFQGKTNGYNVEFTQTLPNGGGANVNNYTVIFDLLEPAPYNWAALINTDPGNNNDADFYIRNDGAVGLINYSAAGVIKTNAWYRLAVTISPTDMTWYVNGTNVLDRPGTGVDRGPVSGGFDIYSSQTPGPDMRLFNENYGDGNKYTHALYVAAFAFVDRTLTPTEIAALGGPKTNGIFQGTPIFISAASSGTNFTLNWNGGKGPFQIEHTFSLSLPSWQNTGGASYERSFDEPRGTNADFFRVIGN